MYYVTPDTPIHTRKQAADLGFTKYWTGRPCSKGHKSYRYVNSGACLGCLKGYQQAFRNQKEGLTKITAFVWHEDAQMVRDWIDAVNTERGFAAPQYDIVPDFPDIPPGGALGEFSCANCGFDDATMAKGCPHCGEPLAEAHRKKLTEWLAAHPNWRY